MGRPQRAGPTRPLTVPSGAGYLPSLGLQWRPSSGTPQPRPRLLLPAQQLRPPRPFSLRTPTSRSWVVCACADPLPAPNSGPLACLPARFPNKSPFHRVPRAHAIPRVGGRCGAGGRVLLPARLPSPAGDRRRSRAHTLWRTSTHPIVYPRCPHFCTVLLIPALSPCP